VHYPEETKWKVIEMKKDGYSNRTIMEKLGIKNVSQIKTWMKWLIKKVENLKYEKCAIKRECIR
ncbi:hypothetical protein ABE234_17610, partial [Bacillus wiedmannii]